MKHANHYAEEKMTHERLERLTRIYHSSFYAAEATGHSRGSLERAAKRHGLRFRNRGIHHS